MNQDRMRLYGGVAAAVLFAALGGFGLAKYTSSPSAALSAEGEERAKAPATALAMKPEAIKAAGIVVEPAGSGGLTSEILAQATVTATPNGQAVLTARASGAVTRIFKRLGDPVAAGEALAIVESREAAQIAADRSVAAAKATLAMRNLAREKLLYDQRVSPRMDYEQAQAEAAAASAEVRRAQVSAGAAKVTADGRGVVVSSPIAGSITAAPASLGAYVQPETELFRVANPLTTQIEAAVSGADAARIAAGDRAILELPDGRTLEGKVRAITPGLNAETRSAVAVVEIVNLGLLPGQTAQIRLYPRGAVAAGVVVADEAVQTLQGRDVVFVRTGEGFRAMPVTTGRRSAGRIEILSGLRTGQAIASRNAFLLKAELAKGEGEEE